MEPRDYRVEMIDGDYAHLIDTATGESLLIARALIPEEADEGDMLHYENLSYEII